MCGRYALNLTAEVLAQLLGLADEHGDLNLDSWLDGGLDSWAPRYNVAPGTAAPIVRAHNGGRVGELHHWGWASPWGPPVGRGVRGVRGGGGREQINARSEKLDTAYRHVAASGRCVALATHFYEPRKLAGMRRGDQQWCFNAPDAQLMQLACIYDDTGFAILTTEPNAVVAPVHDRMPVILEGEALDRWLDPNETDTRALKGLLRPFDAARVEGWRVDMQLLNSGRDEPRCVEEVVRDTPGGGSLGTLFEA